MSLTSAGCESMPLMKGAARNMIAVFPSCPASTSWGCLGCREELPHSSGVSGKTPSTWRITLRGKATLQKEAMPTSYDERRQHFSLPARLPYGVALPSVRETVQRACSILTAGSKPLHRRENLDQPTT